MWFSGIIQSFEGGFVLRKIFKRWRLGFEATKELEEWRYGIKCFTREIVYASWIHSEIGSLSKLLAPHTNVLMIDGVTTNEF